MVRRIVATLLLMALCLVYAPAGVAAAASSPWVPPSWQSGTGGTEWLSGSASGEGWVLETETNGPIGSNPRCIMRAISLTGGDRPALGFELVAGDCGSSVWSDLDDTMRKPLEYRCDGGGWTALSSGLSWTRRYNSGSTQVTGGTLSLVSAPCSSWSGAEVRSIGRASVWYNIRDWQWTMYGGGLVAVSLVCSDGASVQVVQSSGASVSASCPAGMTVVGGSLSRDGQVVSEVAAPSGVSRQQQVAVARGEGRPVVTQGGYSCDPTMALGSPVEWCQRWGSTGAAPAGAVCQFDFDDVSLAVVTLSQADCASWREVIGGGTPGTDPSDDGDTNLILEWLQRIKAAVDAVKSAIVGVGQSIVQAIEDLGDKLDDLGSGSGGNGPGVGPGPGAAPGPSGDPGDLAGKFGPWLDLWGSLTGAGFGPQASDCRGPAMELQLGGTTHTWYLLDACGARAQLATVSRVVLSVVLVWATVMATIRVLASALGLQLRMGE